MMFIQECHNQQSTNCSYQKATTASLNNGEGIAYKSLHQKSIKVKDINAVIELVDPDLARFIHTRR